MIGKSRIYLSRLARDKGGATSLEYCLLAGVLVVSLMVGLEKVGHTMQAQFDLIGSQLERDSPDATATGRLTAILVPSDD